MSMKEIASRVTRKPGGFDHVTMRELRDAHGTQKLGRRVVRDIHDEMEGVGLGHCGHPGEDLPTDQNALVWVYSHKAKVAELISDLQSEPAAVSTVRRIRELIG